MYFEEHSEVCCCSGVKTYVIFPTDTYWRLVHPSIHFPTVCPLLGRSHPAAQSRRLAGVWKETRVNTGKAFQLNTHYVKKAIMAPAGELLHYHGDAGQSYMWWQPQNSRKSVYKSCFIPYRVFTGTANWQIVTWTIIAGKLTIQFHLSIEIKYWGTAAFKQKTY